MSTATQITPASAESVARPIVVATSGCGRATLPVVVAERVALRLDAAPQALAVIEPLPDYGQTDSDAAQRELDRAASVYDLVREEITREAGAAWPTQVAVGAIAPTTAAIATERHARLIVLGLGDPHDERGPRDDAPEIEEAMQLLRCGATPVLAAGADANGIFRRAVVGIDFGEASVRVASLACRLLAPGGMLSLVHVEPRLELSEPAWDAWDERARPLVRGLLQRLAVELPGTTVDPFDHPCMRRDVTIGSVTLVGDPAAELVDYAARMGADLVAVGAHGPGDVADTYLGNVSANVLRHAAARLPTASVIACRAPDAERA